MLPVGDGNAGGRTLGLLPFRWRVEDSKALRIKWLRVFELLTSSTPYPIIAEPRIVFVTVQRWVAC